MEILERSEERHELKVRQEGPRVLLVIDGRATLMPWHVALDLAAALREKAKAAEELAKAEGIIFDQAILLRKGFRFGLTSHPLLQRLAGKEAAWNRNLRRYLPGGVRSQEMVGTPTLIQHPPIRRRKGDG